MELDDWILKKLFGSNAGLEPERLAEEKLTLQDETENLAFSHYKTFIQAANCSKEIFDDFTLVDQHLEGLVSRLPDLGSECRSFLQEAQKIGGKRAANSLTLHKHPQILEVMDTCVRANYWEEALELAQYVGKLQRRLGHIPVIQSIAEEVESQRQLLLEQLLDQLHTQLSLPQCLKVVGFLRRLGAFTETELRIKFLLSRDSWFRSLLASVPADDAYQHITKVMELSRVHLFDIITQYRAVFSDDDPLSMGPLPSASGLGQPLAVREEIPSNLAAVFQSWIAQKVEEFLQTLETDLQRGVGGRLDSVLAQCMYFGLSFGRVGADFRSLVCPAFERAAINAFTNHLDPASTRMLQEVSNDEFLDKVQLGSHSGAPSALLSHHAASGDTTVVSVNPPVTLMDWNGLAIYCNAILSGFNEIRLCLPLTLAGRVAASLRNSLGAIAESLATLADSQKKAWNERKEEKFRNAIHLLVEVLVPFLNQCLETLFPTKALAGILGLGVTDFEKVNEICRINVDALRGSFDEFLPKTSIVPTQMIDATKEVMVEETKGDIYVATPPATEPATVKFENIEEEDVSLADESL